MTAFRQISQLVESLIFQPFTLVLCRYINVHTYVYGVWIFFGVSGFNPMERYIILEIFIYNILDRVECDWMGSTLCSCFSGSCTVFTTPFRWIQGKWHLDRRSWGERSNWVGRFFYSNTPSFMDLWSFEKLFPLFHFSF